MPEANIPKTITLGEQEYSVMETAELKNLVTTSQEVIRKQQYQKITDLTTKNTTLTAELETLRNMAEITGSNQSPMKANSGNSQNAVSQNQPTPVEQQGSQQNMNDSSVIDFLKTNVLPAVNEVKARLEKVEQDQVTEYLQKRLAEEGDNVIPELVKGNSKEEIETSIAQSKTIVSRYKTTTPVTPQSEGQTQPAPVTPAAQAANPQTNPVVIPAAQPRHLQPDQNEGVDISKLSNDDYAKHRDKLQADMRNKYN